MVWNNKAFLVGILVIPVAVMLLGTAIGGSVSIPNTFQNGQVADADQVNQNFTALAVAVNDNDTRIDSLCLDRIGVFSQHDFAIPSGHLHNYPLPRRLSAQEMAGQPYRFTCKLIVSNVSASQFEAPMTVGDVNFNLVFHAGTAAEVQQSFTVALDAVPGAKSTTVTGAFPAPLAGPLGHFLPSGGNSGMGSITLHLTSTTAAVSGSQLFYVRGDFKLQP